MMYPFQIEVKQLRTGAIVFLIMLLSIPIGIWALITKLDLWQILLVDLYFLFVCLLYHGFEEEVAKFIMGEEEDDRGRN